MQYNLVGSGFADISTIAYGVGIEKKLSILTDAAKYDVACTSSGVDFINYVMEIAIIMLKVKD
ncbi:MAG: hypothetical protein R3Y24_07375 [Eubacteriales bacterium]